MKKSERIQREAIQTLLMSLVTLSATIAAGVWSVSAWFHHPALGLGGAAIVLIGLAIAFKLLADAISLARRADYEDLLEMERAIRPRL